MGGSRRGTGGPDLLKMKYWLYVSLEILVRTPLEKQLDPLGPITSRWRFVRPSVKYTGD